MLMEIRNGLDGYVPEILFAPVDCLSGYSSLQHWLEKENLIQTPSVTRIQAVDELFDSVWGVRE
ncbi:MULTISPECIES: hypothetical protein [Paenibacillus]|uniref:Uncharacterized protein n=1 Tax=Paenibacillus borealis TaxID=160799 RepID=A0ABX3HH44_PAEBO|nr:hypothetical protein [Paenibacillus borealis]OMD49503.1 hypothetical protein BSK56_09115 [Paenibacillus borealis]